MDFSVKTTESTITNAMDQFYSWLVQLVGPQGSDKVALMGSILTATVDEKSPMYTNWVFRSFADRTIGVSPVDLGRGNNVDRYSTIYHRVIDGAFVSIRNKGKLTARDEKDLTDLDQKISTSAEKISKILNDASTAWITYAEQNHFEAGTPEYDLQRAAIYNPYLTRASEEHKNIYRAQSKKSQILEAAFEDDADALRLAIAYNYCNSDAAVQYLPLSPSIESIYKLDMIKIAEAAQLIPSAFESTLSLQPSSDLAGELLTKDGVREVIISKGATSEYTHDRTWTGGGSASWFPIFSANVSTSDSTKFKESLNQLESITITCKYMAEFWAVRKDWFDSGLFDNKYVKNYLKRHKRDAALLANVISSLIMVRGLSVAYTFKDGTSTESWRNHQWKSGGGFGIFGIRFGGLGGSGSDTTWDHETSTDGKTVRFFDGDNVVRLLAMRVSNVLTEITPEESRFEAVPWSESAMGKGILRAWADGDLNYGVVPDSASALKVHAENLEESKSDEEVLNRRVQELELKLGSLAVNSMKSDRKAKRLSDQ